MAGNANLAPNRLNSLPRELRDRIIFYASPDAVHVRSASFYNDRYYPPKSTLAKNCPFSTLPLLQLCASLRQEVLEVLCKEVPILVDHPDVFRLIASPKEGDLHLFPAIPRHFAIKFLFGSKGALFFAREVHLKVRKELEEKWGPGEPLTAEIVRSEVNLRWDDVPSEDQSRYETHGTRWNYSFDEFFKNWNWSGVLANLPPRTRTLTVDASKYFGDRVPEDKLWHEHMPPMLVQRKRQLKVYFRGCWVADIPGETESIKELIRDELSLPQPKLENTTSNWSHIFGVEELDDYPNTGISFV